MQPLQAAMADYGTAVLFLLAVIEGPVVVLGATALSQMGKIDIRWVWLVAVLADVTGDILLYAVGRFLPDLLPRRHRPHMAQEKAFGLFRRSGAGLLIMAKLTHFAGLPTLVTAGFARMPFGPFVLCSLVGTVVKVSAIILAGWYFWQTLAQGDMRDAVRVLLGLGVVGALALLLYRSRKWTLP